MNCPKCEKEMEEGFLWTVPLMEWMKGKSRPETERLENIINLGHEPGRPHNYIKSFRCENRRLVTFEY